jgi:hypothetical protein
LHAVTNSPRRTLTGDVDDPSYGTQQAVSYRGTEGGTDIAGAVVVNRRDAFSSVLYVCERATQEAECGRSRLAQRAQQRKCGGSGSQKGLEGAAKKNWFRDQLLAQRKCQSAADVGKI